MTHIYWQAKHSLASLKLGIWVSALCHNLLESVSFLLTTLSMVCRGWDNSPNSTSEIARAHFYFLWVPLISSPATAGWIENRRQCFWLGSDCFNFPMRPPSLAHVPTGVGPFSYFLACQLTELCEPMSGSCSGCLPCAAPLHSATPAVEAPHLKCHLSQGSLHWPLGTASQNSLLYHVPQVCI